MPAGSSDTGTWGTHSLTFTLPMMSLRFEGLSPSQRDTLFRTYPDFIRPIPATPCDEGPSCRAYRLKEPPGVSTETLTADGRYAPRKTRSGQSLELIGINFQASVGVDGKVDSSLGVMNEDELPLCNVIENFLRVYAAHHALRHDGVILHSAGLVFDDRTYVFVGRSNAGKTTLTRKAHAAGARVLSDDINLVLPGKQGYCAFAVPFTGEFGRKLNETGGPASHPVAGIVLLRKSDRLEINRVRKSEAVARLLVGCPFVNTGTDESALLFDVLGDLVSTVPVVSLTSRRDDSIEDIMQLVTRDLCDA